MADVPFKVISWSEFDVIDEDKMDALVTNDIWLRDNMMRGQYRGHNIRITEGVKMLSGMVYITSRKQSYATTNVSFGGFFLSTCQPIVTIGIVSSHQRRIFATLDGIGKMHPDSRGFQIHVQVEGDTKKQKKIQKNFYVNWQAMGY